MNAQIRTIFVYACTKIKSRQWLGVTVQFNTVLYGPAVFAGPLTFIYGETIMPIKYYLLENKINKKEGTYHAKVLADRNANMEDVIKYMSDSGFRSHPAYAIRVLAYFQSALEAMLLQGYYPLHAS